MNKKTGIAGYTLIYNSHGLRLKAHTPFTSVEDALINNTDIETSSEVEENDKRRMLVKDTDIGKRLLERLMICTSFLRTTGGCREHTRL